MRVKSLCGAAALLLAAGGPAAAASATPEEAQRLQGLFERYAGKPAPGAPGAVTVTPAGDSYRVDVDLARLMAPLDAFGIKIVATGPYTTVLTPRDDGAWRVRNDGFPALAFSKDDQTTTLKYEGYSVDGVFDPKLEAMREQTSTLSGLTGGTESALVSNQQRYTARITGRQTARDAGDGSVTMESHQAAADVAYALTMQGHPAAGDPPATPFAVTATLPTASSDTALSHVSTASLLDLWAFLVAHPSKPEIRANGESLKAILRAILAPGPLASLKGELGKLAVTTPIGVFAVDRIAEVLDLGGDGTTQTARFGLHYAGLSFPADHLPPWAAKLVPTALDLDLAVGPLHLHDGLRKAVAEADFSADPPLTDAQATAVAHAVADPAAFAVTLQPSTLKSPLMSVTARGSARMDATGAPISDLTVTASGLDDALDALNGSAQDDPTAAQAAAMLALAKQTAVATGPGTYSWTVEAAPGRPATVNGKPLAQAPPADQDPDAPTEP